MRRFWFVHGLLPLAVLAPALAFIWMTHLDLRAADRLFFDWGARRWIGAGSWWADDLIHTGGRNLVRLTAILALAMLAASLASPRLRRWRRDSAYVALAIVLSTGLTGALKGVTNIDCPWDLQRYGGTRPYVGLFQARPADLPRARCFPGAHSSSGFALMCFYFVLRARSRCAARRALLAGAAAGLLFAFGQQARGAHFISHDLASALLVWYVLLGLYARLLLPRVGTPNDAAEREPCRTGAPARTILHH